MCQFCLPHSAHSWHKITCCELGWGRWIVKWIHHDGVCVFLAEGSVPVLGMYQTFQENPTSALCSIPDDRASSLAMRLDRTPSGGSAHTLANTLYRPVFVPIQVQSQPLSKNFAFTSMWLAVGWKLCMSKTTS